MSDTEVKYLAEYQDGTHFRDDDTPGGTWWVTGGIYGCRTIHDARDALVELSDKGKRVTGRRIWKITTTQELVE